MVLASQAIRGNRNSVWFLRVDVETLALSLYGTRAFHDAHREQHDRPCAICAITTFTPPTRVLKAKPTLKNLRRVVSQKRKSKRLSH
jgi:hypothetical protein